MCMIEFQADVSKTTLSTSYHVFKLISTHQVTQTLPTTPAGGNTTSLFWVAGRNEETEGVVMKFANYNTTNHEDTPVRVKVEGLKRGSKATLTLLTGKEGPFGFNEPTKNVVMEEKRVLKSGGNRTFDFVMPELSVALLDVESGRRNGGKKLR